MTATPTLLEVWCWMVLGAAGLWLALRGLGTALMWWADRLDRMEVD